MPKSSSHHHHHHNSNQQQNYQYASNTNLNALKANQQNTMTSVDPSQVGAAKTSSTKAPPPTTTLQLNTTIPDSPALGDFRPLDFVIGLKTSQDHQHTSQDASQIAKSILEFFNLTLHTADAKSRAHTLEWTKTKKIIDALNFVRFGSTKVSNSSPSESSSNMWTVGEDCTTAATSVSPSPISSDRSDRLLSSSSSCSSSPLGIGSESGCKLGVPSFSLVLLTNSPSTCRPLVDQDVDVDSQPPNSSNDSFSSFNWLYHYKIELNDERGKPIARQVGQFFQT